MSSSALAVHRTGKRHEIQMPDVSQSYEVDWRSLDDLIDAGLTQLPVRGFPAEWTAEAVGYARHIYGAKSYATALKACEEGISRVYQRRRYSPSWNAPLFPEADVLAAAGTMTRVTVENGSRKKTKLKTARKAAASAGRCPGDGSAENGVVGRQSSVVGNGTAG